MVMDAVAEPYSLEIYVESAKVVTLALALVLDIYGLQHPADAQVVTAVLIPQDVPPPECRLTQMIEQDLLPECQALKAWHTIAQHLQVGKALIAVDEMFRSQLYYLSFGSS